MGPLSSYPEHESRFHRDDVGQGCMNDNVLGPPPRRIARRCPVVGPSQEIVQARWGDAAHKVFLFFALLTNIIVTSMLLLGGAATVNALTGVNLNLASFLIPWGVIAYTMHGGLKATFLASYTHTAVLFVALLIFVFVIYTGSDDYVGRYSREDAVGRG